MGAKQALEAQLSFQTNSSELIQKCCPGVMGLRGKVLVAWGL